MILSPPLHNIQDSIPLAPTPDDIYISQKFGNVWIAEKDFILNNIQLYKGDNVYQKLFGWLGHNGTDYRAPLGTPIYAMHSGYVVESVTKESGYGIRVTTYHEADGFEWLLTFGHMQKSVFAEVPFDYNNRSIKVSRGDLLGYVDSTGISTGHHCHISLYQHKNGQRLNLNNGFNGAIDPQKYVKDKFMEILQVEGEKTLVLRNLDGKFFEIATSPELYPVVDKIFGIGDKKFPFIPRSQVETNKVGDAKAGVSLVI